MTTISTDITPSAQELITEAQAIVKDSWPTITDQRGYEEAAAARKDAKAKLAQLEKEKEEIYRPVKTGLDKITAFFKPHLANLEGFIKAVDKPMVAYVFAEQRKADALREEQELMAKRKAEEDRLALVEMMVETGQDELSKEVLAAPVVAAPVEVAPVAVAAGTSTRKTAEATIVDKMALLSAIVAGTVDHRCADINMAEVRRWVAVHGVAPAGVAVTERITIVNR